MSSRLSKLLMGCMICISVAVALVLPAQAQNPTPPAAPSPAPVVPTPIPVSSSPDVVTFAQLQAQEIQLIGPFDSSNLSFFMPAGWQLQPTLKLTVSLGASFNTLIQGPAYTPVPVSGGILTATLNGVTIGVLPINQLGETQWNIEIDPSAFSPINADNSMFLRFVLNSGISCDVNQHMLVFIHPNSFFTLPHTVGQPDMALAGFPRPIIQGGFSPSSALLVLPDHPSAAELQSALTVAAGLGNLSAGTLGMNMTQASQLTPEQASTNHVIFVGKAASLPELSPLHLPLPIQGGKLEVTGSGPDDGYVQMVSSPWDVSHAALVVSGNTDAGVVKAAQSVSTGVLRANQFPNLAVVQQVQPAAVYAPQAVDQTLADLGYAGDFFRGRGTNTAVYSFIMPPGRTVAADSYFELAYGNSSLLDFNRSAVVILLNNRPIGSVRMSDITAANPVNRVRFILPPAAVQPGRNVILVVATRIPTDDCTPPGTQDLWINLWPESLLHLPLDVSSANVVGHQDLASYPLPFTYDPLLNSTAFVLPKDDLASWTAAMHIAADLGLQAGGPLTELTTFYGDSVAAQDRPNYNFIVVGRPSQLPFVNEINDSLPAPFEGKGDQATEKNLQVTYRITPDANLGYLETLPSPWSADKMIVAVLGTQAQGITAAASALVDPILRVRLGGNFASINGTQIITSDIRAAAAAGAGSAPAAGNAPAAGGNAPAASLPSARPVWLLPVLIVSILLALGILVLLLGRNTLRKRGPRAGD